MRRQCWPLANSLDDSEFAIVRALPLEYDAVSLLFDEFWDENCDTYGRPIEIQTYMLLVGLAK